MMAVHSGVAGAWWKQLSDFLHERTSNQLRRLTIRTDRGRVAIAATAPNADVRDEAEAAAREAIPSEMLALLIRVEGEEQKPVAAPSPTIRRGPPEIFQAESMHRRLHRLVSGN